jgi:hypothetical protein
MWNSITSMKSSTGSTRNSKNKEISNMPSNPTNQRHRPRLTRLRPLDRAEIEQMMERTEYLATILDTDAAGWRRHALRTAYFTLYALFTDRQDELDHAKSALDHALLPTYITLNEAAKILYGRELS